MQSTRAEPDLRGLALVVMTYAWLTGIVLASLLLLPSFALLIGAGAAVVLVILLWRDGQGRLIMLIILCLLLGAWRYASVSPVKVNYGFAVQHLRWYFGAASSLTHQRATHLSRGRTRPFHSGG